MAKIIYDDLSDREKEIYDAGMRKATMAFIGYFILLIVIVLIGVVVFSYYYPLPAGG